MPKEIDRKELQRLVANGVQLVEVLGAKEYEEEHLPGAISLPLRSIDAEAGDKLDRNRAVIVYCWDMAWDNSPRAAWRLESLGFKEVYDYKPGKLDWMAAGLPTEGKSVGKPRAGDLARKDVATCSLGEKLSDVRDRLRAMGGDAAVVVNSENVVLGILRAEELNQDGDVTVDRVMQPGPSTFRPYVTAQEMADFTVEHSLDSSPITTYDGKLIGLLYKTDAVREARKQAAWEA